MKFGKRMMGYHLALAFSLFCMSCCAYSVNASEKETKAVESNVKNSNSICTLYDSSTGLPTSEANDIVQTSDGFIWIASYSGLVRYDGNEFERMDTNKTGIASVVSLFVDSKDRLWIGTNDSGVCVYENHKYSFLDQADGLKSSSVRTIAQNEKGNIYLGTTNGVAYIKNGKVKTIEDELLRDEYITKLSASGENPMIGLTMSGMVFTISHEDEVEVFTKEELPFANVTAVYAGSGAQQYYFATEDGLIYNTKVIENHIVIINQYQAGSLKSIKSLKKTTDGKLWVCADNGIGYIDDNGYQQLHQHTMNNSVDRMMEDYEGNLWFTSSRQGVMKMAKSPFYNFSENAELPETVNNAITKYNDRFYIGTDEGLVILDQNKKQVTNELTKRLEHVRVRSLIEDNRGTLWIGSYAGVFRYNEDTGQIFSLTTLDGLTSNKVRYITPTGVLNQFLVATSGGLNVVENGKVIQTYSVKQGLINTEILSACRDQDSKIYAGSDGGGIYIIDNGKVTNINKSNGLPSDVILSIKRDPISDLIWVVTGNGICYLQDEKVTAIKNFPYPNNYEMHFSKDDKVWVLSSNGIYVANREEMLKNKKINCRFYNTVDGLPSNITSNSKNYVDKDGTIYLCGIKGISTINMYADDISINEIRVSIPAIKVGNKMIYTDGKKMKIPADEKRIIIYPYVLSYIMQEDDVTYQLVGFDDQPIHTTNRQLDEISYTNLKGGKYQFELKVTDKNTGKVKESRTISIEIRKKLYEYGLFWFVVVVMLALLLMVLVLSYIKAQKRRFQRKQEKDHILLGQVLEAFSKAIDEKDTYTKGHSERVAQYASAIALHMGYNKKQTEEVKNIALLHDIGKITVSNEILNKPEQLTEEEYEQVKQHTETGSKILKEITAFSDLYLGARYHHERIDGEGYPVGLKENEIPEIAKIIAVADTFDAMNSTRPYREHLPKEEIIKELKRVAGTQLDEHIVMELLELIQEGSVTCNEEK